MLLFPPPPLFSLLAAIYEAKELLRFACQSYSSAQLSSPGDAELIVLAARAQIKLIALRQHDAPDRDPTPFVRGGLFRS